MIPMVTDIMKSSGLNGDDSVQNVEGIFVYAPDYFNPLDDATGRLRKTDNTRTIHWFMKSWMGSNNLLKVWCKRILRRIWGKDSLSRIKAIVKK